MTKVNNKSETWLDTFHNADSIESALDYGIRDAVLIMRKNGIETFESCQGGNGHAYFEPTIRFHGQRDEGWRALAVAQMVNLKVAELRRIWPVIDGEPTGPWWEMTFRCPTSQSG